MARPTIATDWCPPAWQGLFSFTPDIEDLGAVQRLRELGVHDVEFIWAKAPVFGCFMDLGRVSAKRGVVVSVAWLAAVRESVFALGPAIHSEVRRVAAPDRDDPATDCRQIIDEGQFLVDLRMVFHQSETYVSARGVLPKVKVVDAVGVV